MKKTMMTKVGMMVLCGALLLSGCSGGADQPEEQDNKPAVNAEANPGTVNETESEVEGNTVNPEEEQSGEETTMDESEAVELDLSAMVKIDVPGHNFAVDIKVERPENDPEGWEAATVIYRIYDMAEGTPTSETVPFQEITVGDYYMEDEAPFHMDDYNFDGANDFSLWLWSGSHNVQGRFFLWDEAEDQFVENLTMGQLTSPMVKKELQMILEHVHVSGAEYADVLYRWEDGELVYVRRIIQDMPVMGTLQAEVSDYYDGNWELMFERKIMLSEGDWTEEDYAKIDDLARELSAYYDPSYIGL